MLPVLMFSTSFDDLATSQRARTDYVREQMCKRYLQIWHELSDTLPDGLSQTSARSLEIPSLLQYFVGSKDYMSLIDVLPEPASVFKRESEVMASHSDFHCS
jgi:hypothetical protein